jgi:membrane protein
MSPRAIFELLKEAYDGWSEDNASRLAAALAYYTVFSLAPLLLIAISVAGLVFGEKAAQGQVFAQLQGVLGPEAAQTIQSAIEKSSNTGASTVSTIIGLVTLVLGASGVFGELQSGLDTVWEVQPKPGGGIVATVKRRFLSMTMVLGIGFLLLVSLLLSVAVSAAGQWLGNLLPGGEALWQAVNFVLSLALMTLLFAAIYKVLPDVEIGWRDVWVGAAATAALFTVGKTLIGLYLGHSSVGSAYGAAGSLLVLLVWVYYSAQILYFGAELTQAWASKYGTGIVPSAGAVPLTEAARAQQGIPHRTGTRRAAPGARPANATPFGRTPQQIKRLLWAGLVTATLGLAGVLARLGSAAIWRAILHESPPGKA